MNAARQLRILLTHRPGGAWGFITDGLKNAFAYRGHIAERWDGNIQSWEEFQPDLAIMCSGHKQPIPPKRSAKVIIHVNPYGHQPIPGIDETKDNIKWVLDQKPDAVFGYGHETDRHFWTHWTEKHGIPWIPVPTAADATIFKNLKKPKQYDIAYLGGHWSYKAKTIDAYLLPVLNKVKTYKIHGWGDWPSGICSGQLPDEQVNEFLNNGTITPCISELHTHTHGIDIPERAFKVALCGGLVIHDNTQSIKKMIPSAIVTDNPNDFLDKCMYYLKNENERNIIAAKQESEVALNNTYDSRINTILQSINLLD